MAFEGALLSRPSDPTGERPIAESLSLFYYGVQAPELPVDVVSPNGYNVNERQTLADKVVRPSTVNARLIAPDGSERPVDSGAKTTLGCATVPLWRRLTSIHGGVGSLFPVKPPEAGL